MEDFNVQKRNIPRLNKSYGLVIRVLVQYLDISDIQNNSLNTIAEIIDDDDRHSEIFIFHLSAAQIFL